MITKEFLFFIFCLTALSSVTSAINYSKSCKLTYPRYKTCDESWGNDQLWINFYQPGRNFTFCNDEEGDGEAMFFDAKLMTLFAEGVKARNIPCGEYGDCTPGVINKLIIDFKSDGQKLWDLINVHAFDPYYSPAKLAFYLENNYIILTSKEIEGKWKWFIVTAFDGVNVNGIDHEGNDLVLPFSEISAFISGWQVKDSDPYRENLKFLE